MFLRPLKRNNNREYFQEHKEFRVCSAYSAENSMAAVVYPKSGAHSGVRNAAMVMAWNAGSHRNSYRCGGR
jgi:hypothetical protein